MRPIWKIGGRPTAAKRSIADIFVREAMAGELSRRILVVDDEEAVVEVLRYLLEDEGYGVVTAAAEDAVALAASETLAAAVLDVSMGRFSGLELAASLRLQPGTAQLPIVLLTGLAEQDVRRQFTGYDLFVSKVADLSEFVARLARLLQSRESGTPMAQAEPS